MEIGDVTVDTFAGREGERFWITFADGELDLELAAIERPPEHWGSVEREPFSVIFHGKPDAVLFDFNHPLAGQAVTFEVQVIGVL